MSQLEKLTISNYSEYLGDDDERVRRSVTSDQGQHSDQVAEKFSKFADSLMRQRQLQQQVT